MTFRVESVRGGGIGRVSVAAASVLALATMLLLALAPASKAVVPPESEILPNGVERITYYVGEDDGPLQVTSGQNRIDYDPIFGLQRPSRNGWITRIEPNLVRPDGSIPKSSEVMFHHGVWLNASRDDATDDAVGARFPERFYATGEEKTAMELPPGFGYRYEKTDLWILNHMVHNLVVEPMELYVTYTVDFIPDDSPLAEGIEPVRPIWMDVENGVEYPVFDVKRGSGGKDGEFTYPADAGNPYGSGPKENEWVVDRDGVLVQTIGHVHTGGLSTELYLNRDGAKYAGPEVQEAEEAEAGAEEELEQEAQARLQEEAEADPQMSLEAAERKGRPGRALHLPGQVLRQPPARLMGRGDGRHQTELARGGQGRRHPRAADDLRDQDRLLVRVDGHQRPVHG